jgi:hypothetical protein
VLTEILCTAPVAALAVVDGVWRMPRAFLAALAAWSCIFMLIAAFGTPGVTGFSVIYYLVTAAWATATLAHLWKRR